jgi:tau tubulin kinase
VVRYLSRGGFAEVYLAQDRSTSKLCAVKLESEAGRAKSLELEEQILTAVQPSPFFPSFLSSGSFGDLHFMAMELLGPSLSAIQRILPNRVFSVSTMLRLSLDMLHSLETFHGRGYVNRDVKPDNYLIRGTLKNPIALVDYGLARLHIDPATGAPFTARENCQFCGTSAFASVTTHMGRELGRRDDLWSWLYCIIELRTGALPWRAEKDKDRMGDMKKGISMQKLCEGLPEQFVAVGEAIARLEYADVPNYGELAGLIEEAMRVSGVSDEDPFDWEKIPETKWREISAIGLESREEGGCCSVQ